MSPDSAPTTPQPWDGLRRFTDARIALGRAGHSLPTAAHLQFQLAHAQARDAVHVPLEPRQLTQGMQVLGWQTLTLHSAAPLMRARPANLRTGSFAAALNQAAVGISACLTTRPAFANPRCVCVLPMSNRRIMGTDKRSYGVMECLSDGVLE